MSESEEQSEQQPEEQETKNISPAAPLAPGTFPNAWEEAAVDMMLEP